MTPHLISREIRNSVSFGTIRVLILLLGILALLGIIYLVQSTQATVAGQHAQELRDRLDRLDREIDQLEYDIAVLKTPSRIAERARARGLHPPTLAQTVYLPVNNYPAAPPTIPATLYNSTIASNGDSFFGALWNGFLALLGIVPSSRTAEASP